MRHDANRRAQGRQRLANKVGDRVVLGQDHEPRVRVVEESSEAGRPRRAIRAEGLRARVEDEATARVRHDGRVTGEGDPVGGARAQLPLLRVVEHVDALSLIHI